MSLQATWPRRGDGTNKTIGEMAPAEREQILRPLEDQVRAIAEPEVLVDTHPSPAVRAARLRPSSLTAKELAEVRPAELAAIGVDGRIEFRIQRALKNDNSGNRNPHWSKKNSKRLLWQTAMTNALVMSIGHRAACDLLVPESGLFGARGTRVQARRRIALTRLVPSTRNFVKDTFENLPWCAKELRDAINNLGLIRDDSAKWTDTTIDQAVSIDGSWWTWIVIDRTESR